MTRLPFRVDQPRPNDLVGNPLLLAGMGGGFEATIAIRVLDAQGAVLLETSTTSTNLISAWQASIALPDPLPTTRGVVEIAPSTGADEAEARVSVPVFFGPAIVAGYRSYLLHIVQSGETLSGIAASEPLHIGSGPGPIFEANRDILSDPNLIHPGMALRIPSDF
ncbi:MAG: LysM peptidoglycan-binding domain-containing protein [Egibacteraceae bacterium]